MPSAVTQEIVLQGIPVSPGIGIGPVHVVARGFSAPEVYEIREEDVPAEKERFRAALEETKGQLDELQQRLKSISGEQESEIFEAHLMVLEDRAMLDREGADGPADVAIVGSEEEVRAQIARLAEVGTTDFIANEFGSKDEQARTRELLRSL